MLAFIEMLIAPCEKAGIKIPSDLKNYDKNEYPHFFVYTTLQLGAPLPTPTSHWHNAEIVAAIHDSEIKQVTSAQLEMYGWEYGNPIP